MTGNVHPYEQEGVFQTATPWLMAAREELNRDDGRILEKYAYAGVDYTVKTTASSVWVMACRSTAGQIAFRVGYSPSAFLDVKHNRSGEQNVDLSIDTAIGKMRVSIEMPSQDHPALHWTTGITLDREMMFPYWPRDVYVLSQDEDMFNTKGTVHAMQRGPKAGLVYLTVSEPRSGSMFYLQNLTSLNPYADHAHTSLGKTVGGVWPELGFALPPSEKPLPAGEEIILSDGFAQLSPTIPKDQFEAARLFIDLYADIYLQLPWVECEYHDWPSRAEQTLTQLTRSSKVALSKAGKQYFLAYVNSKDKPVEVMVQAAMLISAVEYESWRKKTIPLINRTRKVLPEFYDPKIKSLVRWQPQMQFPDGKLEEQERARIMDSWYLYHPLLNLARLALKGFDDAKDLFFKSVEFGIKAAQTFDYHWPIFYNIDTLKIEKAQAGPDQGGETDVGCIYALVMMHAYDLSGEKRYLEEAEKAAHALADYGFNLPYQLNITAFGLSAFWRLYRETKNDFYKDLALVCLAGILHNTWLWECTYGYARHYPTFMGVLPLQDNAYIASFEELETLAALHDFYAMARDEVEPSAHLLMSEFSRHALHRAWYYYPGELPEEVIAKQPKTGSIERDLAIPLEDLHEGWEQAGQVGQEVYGAGSVYTLLTRHYLRGEDTPFMVYCEYQTADVKIDQVDEQQRVAFKIDGNTRGRCRLRLIAEQGKKIPDVRIQVRHGDQLFQPVETKKTEEGHLEFWSNGDHQMEIYW